MGKFKEPEELRIVQLAEELANKIWDEVVKWDYFTKRTVGIQLVSAADSVGSNIVEGEGRYHWKEEIHFLYISRGSLKETKLWLGKSLKRKLIKKEKYDELINIANNLLPQLNSFITGKKKNVAKVD